MIKSPLSFFTIRHISVLIRFTNLNLLIKKQVSRLFKIDKYSDKKIVEKSGFFDANFYLANYPETAQSDLSAIDHYMLYGAEKDYNPSAYFDALFYKMANPEYLLSYQNPLLHYMKEGKSFDALVCKTFNISDYKELFNTLRQTCPVKNTQDKKKKLNIGFFTHNLNWEGATLICKEIALSMKKTPDITPIIFCHFNGPLKQLYENAGIKVIQHRAFDKTTIRNQRDFNKFINEISSLVSNYNLDVIYANTIISFWVLHIAKKLMIPSVFHIHESEPINYHIHSKRLDYLPLIFQALATANKVVFVSNKTAEKYKPYNNNNFTVIKNAFDPNEIPETNTPAHELRKKLGIQENELMFITVGTVSNRKGQVDIINVITELDEEILSKSHFVLVGDVRLPYSLYLHKRTESLATSKSKRIHFIDKTPHVFDYYHAADACIFTSRIESYPKAIQEAMHFKLPIISTPVDGISEQLQEGISGLFYPPGDVKKLSELITLLVTDNHMRERLGENAFSSLQKMISPEKMMKTYYQLFRCL